MPDAILGARADFSYGGVCNSAESEEVRRKTPVYAHESLEKEIGRSSQGLALKQFLVLREEKSGFGPRRSCELIRY